MKTMEPKRFYKYTNVTYEKKNFIIGKRSRELRPTSSYSNKEQRDFEWSDGWDPKVETLSNSCFEKGIFGRMEECIEFKSDYFVKTINSLVKITYINLPFSKNFQSGLCITTKLSMVHLIDTCSTTYQVELTVIDIWNRHFPHAQKKTTLHFKFPNK